MEIPRVTPKFDKWPVGNFRRFDQSLFEVRFLEFFIENYIVTRNPASRASKRARLVAMYIAVAIRPSSYVHRVTSEVAVSFLPEVIAQI